MDQPSELIAVPAESTWTDDQRRAATAIMSGPRGALIGPFGPLLHSPGLLDPLQRTGEYIRWHSNIPADLREFVILIVARHWDQAFEWHHHWPIAVDCGVSEDVVAAVGASTRPTSLSSEQEVVWDLVTSLLTTGTVSREVVSASLDALGETVVIELVATVGYYTTLAFIMNTAGTPEASGRALPNRMGDR